MSAVATFDLMPDELYDEDEQRMWLRADGRTRGQAQAQMACEIGCDFTDILMRKVWLRQDGIYESEPGVAATAICHRDDAGALSYWYGQYEDANDRRRRRNANAHAAA